MEHEVAIRGRTLIDGSSRLVADRPAGFWHVLVNGVPIRRDTVSLLGELSSLPGRVLRSC